MGHKCKCGRFFMSPLPTTCSKCGETIPGGCLEGDSYRIITEKQPNNQLVHVFTRIGGIVKQPKVIDKIQLAPGCFVEFLDDWNEDSDTGNLPKVRR